MNGPAVDVVVATHSPGRPAHRAVLSALRDADEHGVVPGGHRVRVTVACHELEPDPVRRRVEAALAEAGLGHLGAHVRYLEVRDGLGSPSGPFNAGIAASDARYVSIIGSDDWFAPGALGAWATRADELGSGWLLPRLETQDGEHIPTPRVRPGRTTDLDLVRDRLAYRTAPLGLLRRETLEGLGLLPGDGSGPLTAGMRTGGDIELGLRLASGPVRVDYGLDLPPYVIGTTGGDRITEAVRPLESELAPFAALVRRPWVGRLPKDERRALAVKLLRIHVLAAVRRRDEARLWQPGDAETAREVVAAYLALAPGVGRALHRADEDLVQEVLAAQDADDLAAASARRAAAGRFDILLTRGPLANLDRESTVRSHLDTALSSAWLAARQRRHGTPGSQRPHADPAAAAGVLAGTRVLVLAFSPVRGDARVLKQVRHLLAAGADVVTVGYGQAPDGVTAHVRVPDGVVNELDGRLITLHAYRAAYWAQEAVRWVRRHVAPGTADVVVANDTDTLPLALALRPSAGVHADLHEYWPRWREEHPQWLARIGPYQEWLCRRHLPRCGAVTTVSDRIAEEYSALVGVDVGVVTNASPYQDLLPQPVSSPLRLVHSGACLRSRGIHVMVEGVLQALQDGADCTFDLYLTPNDPDYLAELRAAAQASDGRVRVHDPVPYTELFATLHRHDVGVFVLPPVNFNYANALPNKIFDYVQARLAVLVGPSPDMATVVHRHGLGPVAGSFDAHALATAVSRLDPEAVAVWKAASHAAAHELSDAEQSRAWVESVRDIVRGQVPL
ncbi:glycosyl transferase [Ornithinimicrobium pekingense]|uniref:D-inositol 3-phosphate glycosyltransferase n=1 Tax=Ornithinimicrobium pekingense TaxID=384677 RepID=A0ABQ2F8N2_9MICO|nr:glycosyl transferase [Ornithinimicrobium pekingense]GGK70581.1 hypothetical protein GCM10011509_18800 [Ornithinimicrobium pekingense]